MGRAAAALVDDRVVGDADGLGDEARRLGELVGVAAALGHRGRDAVRGEDDRRRRAALLRDLRERGAHAVGVRLDEARVVVERAQLQHLGRARADRGLRAVDVLAVLAAARVRAERRGEEREHPARARRLELAQRVLEERVPVAVPEGDRQVDAVLAQLGLERGDQLAVLAG